MKAAVLPSVHHGIKIGYIKGSPYPSCSSFSVGYLHTNACCIAQKPPIFLCVFLFLLIFFSCLIENDGMCM